MEQLEPTQLLQAGVITMVIITIVITGMYILGITVNKLMEKIL